MTQISGLLLGVEPAGEQPGHSNPDLPNLSINIDGTDAKQLLGLGRGSVIGMDPETLLADPTILRPALWHRVVIYRCSCGIPDDYAVSVQITRRSDGIISWSDLRTHLQISGVPVVADDDDGDSVLHRPLLFDAERYDRHIEQFANARKWETFVRRVSRIGRAALAAPGSPMADAGYRVRSLTRLSTPARPWALTVENERHHGRLLLTVPDTEDAETTVQAIIDNLATVPSDQWPVAYADPRWLFVERTSGR